MLELVRNFFLAPSRAAESLRRPEKFRAAIRLYAFCAAVSVFFYWLAPPDAAEGGPGGGGFALWLKAGLWQVPMELAWVFMAAALASWLGRGRLAPRLAAAIALASVPLLSVLALLRRPFSGPAGLLILAACLAPFIRGDWKKKAPWRPLAGFLLGTNVIALAAFVPMAAAAALGSRSFYEGADIAAGLWMLIVSSIGIRDLIGVRFPRAFMAALLALAFQAVLAADLACLGLISKAVFKALLYA